jgi:hypothetical protein
MKKTIKAWPVVDDEDPSMNWHENRPMIYGTKNDASFNRFRSSKVVPCTITYILPKKKPITAKRS